MKTLVNNIFFKIVLFIAGFCFINNIALCEVGPVVISSLTIKGGKPIAPGVNGYRYVHQFLKSDGTYKLECTGRGNNLCAIYYAYGPDGGTVTVSDNNNNSYSFYYSQFESVVNEMINEISLEQEASHKSRQLILYSIEGHQVHIGVVAHTVDLEDDCGTLETEFSIVVVEF